MPTGKRHHRRQALIAVVTLTASLTTLVARSFWDTVSGGVRIVVCTPACTTDGPRAAADFDLYVYASDQHGTRGDLLVSSAQHPSQADEEVSLPHASGYYLVEVVSFATLEATHYHAEASFSVGGL